MNKQEMTVYMHDRHQRLKTDPEYKAYRAKLEKDKRNRMPEFYRAREFARDMRKYGTTIAWYTERLIEQNGLCAICNHLSHLGDTLQRLQIDHDHGCCALKTKSCGECIRGLLCGPCNLRLSYLEATLIEALVIPRAGTIKTLGRPLTWTERALRYLHKFKETQ